MLRIALIASALLLLGTAPAGAKVRCSSGATAFVDGGLRIFGVHYSTPFESGFREYACLRGAGRRPLEVGGVGGADVGSVDTPAYAVARGGRMLAAYEAEDGEGGPGASMRVVDVRRRRTINFMNVVYDDPVPAFRVTSKGAIILLSPDEDLVLKEPGRRAHALSPGEGAPTDLATSGGTVYWTQGGVAKMTTLDVADTGRMLEPVRLRRRGGPCAAMRGRTIAASGSVRVLMRGDESRACRLGRRPGPVIKNFAAVVPPEIVADRWLFAQGEGTAYVFDTRTGRAVTTLDAVAQTAPLLRDGTLAWLDYGGRLLARTPGADSVVLAESGASPPAAGRKVVYWTEAGIPHRYRP